MPEAGTQLTRHSQELTIFHDVAKALTSSLDLDSILQTIMEKMAEYFRPDTWSLLMVDETQDELYFAIAVGDKAEALKNVRLKVGEGIAGWVAKNGESRVVPDVRTDPFFASRVDEATKWETRSVICVPLRSKLRVLGVIQLVNVDMALFGDAELFFLQALCDYAAIAIENARWVEKIQELTITDDCTGLYNARHLYKTLETEVYRSSRFGYEFSILFIDLDHFKSVNDTHGHLVGSKLLAEIGYLVKAQLRLIDFAFRYGGDEFVVLLPQTGKDSALVVAKRLRDSLRTQVHDVTGGNGADIILDPLGGDVFDAALRALAWRGRLVVIGFAAGRIPTIKANYLLVKNIEVSGLQVSDYRKKTPDQMVACFSELFAFYEAGKIKPLVGGTLPLARWADALRQIQDRSARGRIVLTTGR